MGIFSRRNADDWSGLYTGDPQSVSGQLGTGSAAPASTPIPGMLPAQPGDLAAPAPGVGTPAPLTSGFLPGTPSLAFFPGAPAPSAPVGEEAGQGYPGYPGVQGFPGVQQQFPGYPGPSSTAAPGFLAGAWAANPVRANPSLTYRRARRSVGGVLTATVFILLAVAIPVFFAVRSFTVGTGGIFGSSAPLTGSVDAPVTLDYDGGRISITVTGVTAQPGDEFTGARAGDKPHLVVDVVISRVDSGNSSLRVMAWDWHVGPSADSATIDGDLISDYSTGTIDGKPIHESSPTLAAGQKFIGAIAFASPLRAGVVSLENPTAHSSAAQWTVRASVPTTVKAAFGKAARSNLGAPAFSATAAKPHWITATDRSVIVKPKSGTYLIVPFTFREDSGTTSSAIRGQNLVFVPKGSKAAVQSADPGRVKDILAYFTVPAGGAVAGNAAFDVKKGPGTVQLRDGAGRPVIIWSVS